MRFLTDEHVMIRFPEYTLTLRSNGIATHQPNITVKTILDNENYKVLNLSTQQYLDKTPLGKDRHGNDKPARHTRVFYFADKGQNLSTINESD